MKTVIHILQVLVLLSSFNVLFANGECVIVIQGARQKASDHFIKNSTDVLVQGLGSFPGPPNITVLRPSGEQSGLGNQPARNEQNYSNKAELLAMIEKALCDDKCKNVVIAFIGHGMGGDGINNPPKDSLAGGLMIKNGKTNDDFLLAEDVAKLIDKCKKSVKLIASACYSESMIAGIHDRVRNKGLIGVGVSSSKWNEESWATNGYYDFIKAFLEDYYAVINDPNVMEQLKKNAEELKKKNDKYNKKIEAENKAVQDSIKKCEQELDKLKKERDAIDAKIKETKQKIENAKAAAKLLDERAELEKKYDEAKGKEKTALKKQLDENAKKLRELGVKVPTGSNLQKKLDAIAKEKEAQEKLIKELEEKLKELNAKWMELNGMYVSKEFKLDSLKELTPLVPIPSHLPLMELVIHEAFKSAKTKTKSSTPQEPVAPNTTKIEMPTTPMTRLKVGDRHFRFYKVVDKKTNTCIVVGYECNADGVPLQPLKSKDCNIDCSSLKFAYQDGDQEKTVEAKKGTDGKYKFTVNGTEVSHSRFYSYNQHLILPGHLLEEVYYSVGFGTIEDVYVTNSRVLVVQYNESNLDFSFAQGDSFFDVFIEFLEHDDVSIQINEAPPYLASQAKRYTLLDESLTYPFGELGVIFYADGNNQGVVFPTFENPPVKMEGKMSEDGFRFELFGPEFDLHILPVPSSFSGMEWHWGEKSGPVQLDLQREPEVIQAFTHSLPEGGTVITWILKTDHLSESDIRPCSVMRILRTTETFHIDSFFDVFVDIEFPTQTTIDPVPGTTSDLIYQLLSVCENTSYNVQIPLPYPPEFGSPYSVPGLLVHEPPVTLKKDGIAATPESAGFAVVYPNPFSQSAWLNLTLTEASIVEFKIYNAAGQVVKTNNSFLDGGFHQIEIKGNELRGPGMYFYTIGTTGKVVSGKFVFSPH